VMNMSVEKASYKTVIKEGNFEVRLYDPVIIAVSQENNLKGTSGFNQLFSYISGRNRESKKIAMTAPVINNLDAEKPTIAFVMPKAYSMEELPQPMPSNIQLQEIPKRYLAAISFSGNINQKIIEKKKHELIEWLKAKQITAIGSIELARYNPPFVPGFIKHNELLVEVNPPVE